MKKLAIIVGLSVFLCAVSVFSAESDSSSERLNQTAAVRTDSLPSVPHSLSLIKNPEVRKAVSEFSPNYDELGRGSQVFTYIHVYKSLNDGLMPAVASDDLELIFRREPVERSMPASDAGQYNTVPSVLLETNAQPSRSEWTNRYERYMSDHDLQGVESVVND